jgi:1,4-dihydroxy-2-naphthoate octaprenyltransferase
MKETDIKQDSLKAWLLAARPKTLTGAAVPVIIGLALAGLVGAIGFVVIRRKARRKNGN